ncbi:MAG: hypothetical protein ACUVUQ_09410 [Thermodesulfovibrionales bacterium]
MELCFIIAFYFSLFSLPRIFSKIDLFEKEKSQGGGIVLVPIGKVNKEAIERLKDDLGRLFNKKVFIGKGMPKPDYAFDRNRDQYLSTAILNTLKKQKEYNTYEKILGVIDYDLYVSQLNFIFGEASGKVAVISLTHLRQGFYGLPDDKELF